MFLIKDRVKVKELKLNVKTQQYSYPIQEAVREVFKDRLICTYAGYKITRYKLTTKAAIGKAVASGDIKQAHMAKLLGVNSQALTEWVKDYRNGDMRLENACAIRRV